MTPKQQERIKNKIKGIKSELAADKKSWGGHYHDGRGLRYIPTSLYIQLDDNAGGLRYVNWFDKNFPEDVGAPDVIFEFILILFKAKKLKEAEKKVTKYYEEIGFILDIYFGKKKNENFVYKHDQNELVEFSNWLTSVLEKINGRP